MRVFVVRNRLIDVPFKAVHCQVHLREPDGRRVFLHSIECCLFGRTFFQRLDKMGTLHEHAARAAGRVEHCSVIRLNDIHDHLHERHWGEEFAAVVRL